MPASLEHDSIWDNVRTGLAEQEGARAVEPRQPSALDRYQAQEKAHGSAGGSMRFVDPVSFALAVYGAKAFEAVRKKPDPVPGAAIEPAKDPMESAPPGWESGPSTSPWNGLWGDK